MSDITIAPVRDRRTLKAWLEVSKIVFRDDPAWIQQLDELERHRVSRTKNPFFGHAECELFVATRDGRPVGRISAQINQLFVKQHGQPTGHFGFLEAIDDPQVTKVLTDTAARWLAARGMTRISGPFNFSINDECGLLVDGFDIPPMTMMPHSRRWQAPHLEACGFAGEMDLHAFRLKDQSAFDKLAWLASRADDTANIVVRPLDTSHLEAEVALMVDIFNDAWRDNWGFVPLDVPELMFAIGDLRPFIRSEFGRFVLVDGEPVGFGFGIPNINEIIAPFGGRLLPFNWLKMIWALSFNRYSTGRMPLMGLRKSMQGGILGAAIVAKLLGSSLRALTEHQSRAGIGAVEVEMSWVLATNKPLLSFLTSTFGQPSKTYRIYSKSLDGYSASPLPQ